MAVAVEGAKIWKTPPIAAQRHELQRERPMRIANPTLDAVMHPHLLARRAL